MKVIKLTKAQDIGSYQPSNSLISVLQMAISLGRPLLLAGKPGVGKTQFAHWVADQHIENFNKNVLQFNTKSTSVFADLFYEYDAVSHFRDANINNSLRANQTKSAADYITLTALGFAVLCAKGKDDEDDEELNKIIQQSKQKLKISTTDLTEKSVVLIDEIDKAPRDFPNDLLYEIENLSFTIKEINKTIKLNDKEKENVVIILTSNDEKNLPDAFLRRCLFYYIDFPSEPELKAIVAKKLTISGADFTSNELAGLDEKINWFFKIYHAKTIDKKPSTSECIDWINYLKEHDLLNKDVKDCKDSFSCLVKKNEDLQELNKLFPGLTEANLLPS